MEICVVVAKHALMYNSIPHLSQFIPKRSTIYPFTWAINEKAQREEKSSHGLLIDQPDMNASGKE